MAQPATEAEILQLYRETIDAFYASVSRRCGGDRELAEDIVQETWLRAVREWRSNGFPTNPVGWLTTVARNLLLNELRKRRPVRLDQIRPDEIASAIATGVADDSTEIAGVMLEALARLPENQARLLETFHFDRLRISQIAASMGISERAVEGRLRRAREELRRELEKLLKPNGVPT